MGQQQLLLLVLGIAVAGFAMVGGLGLFNERARQEAADQLVNRNVNIASRAQAWRFKQVTLGESGSNYDRLRGNLRRLSIERETAFSCHQITKATGQVLEVVGVSTRHPDVGVKTVITGDAIEKTKVVFDGSISLPAACRP